MNQVKYLKMKKELDRIQKENKFLRDNYCSKEEIVRLYAIFRCAITETLGMDAEKPVLAAIKDLPYEFCIQQYPKETSVMASRLGIKQETGVTNDQSLSKAIKEVIKS